MREYRRFRSEVDHQRERKDGRDRDLDLLAVGTAVPDRKELTQDDEGGQNPERAEIVGHRHSGIRHGEDDEAEPREGDRCYVQPNRLDLCPQNCSPFEV
ncbi:MAG: hypothetical protein GEU68_14820 [Actinobacteria bacterium]|nr:hypothetical protein [Actinomycetota bacterium]